MNKIEDHLSDGGNTELNELENHVKNSEPAVNQQCYQLVCKSRCRETFPISNMTLISSWQTSTTAVYTRAAFEAVERLRECDGSTS